MGGARSGSHPWVNEFGHLRREARWGLAGGLRALSPDATLVRAEGHGTNTCRLADRSDGLRRLEGEDFLGQRDGELGLANGVTVIALGLRVLVVGPGLGEVLPRLVQEGA